MVILYALGQDLLNKSLVFKTYPLAFVNCLVLCQSHFHLQPFAGFTYLTSPLRIVTNIASFTLVYLNKISIILITYWKAATSSCFMLVCKNILNGMIIPNDQPWIWTMCLWILTDLIIIICVNTEWNLWFYNTFQVSIFWKY